MNILDSLIQRKTANRKSLAVLIDPDKYTKRTAERFISIAAEAQPDFIFVGGSLTNVSTDVVISQIKSACSCPIVLFPGNATQFTDKADAILLLSRISGRNPDFLIGQHVIAAPFIRRSGIESISTGYILVSSGATTSVEYISNTKPIPREKNDIAVATAMAGELIGNRLIYLEAGSGAVQPVPQTMIRAVRQSVQCPIIVGGGLRSDTDILNALNAGADVVVTGNTLETEPEKMILFADIVRNYSK